MEIVLLYFVIAVIAVISFLFVMEKLEGDCQEYSGIALLIGLFWPIFLPLGLIFIPFFLLNEGIKICILRIKK